MSYRVQKENGIFLIVEKDTDQIIRRCGCEREARDLCRSLNLGSGFNGFTPSFFLQEYEQKERPSVDED